MKASGASVKLFEYIDRIPKIVNNGIEKPNHFQGRIEFKNVSFAFPNRKNDQVLKNISFTVQPGQQVALVGPSGSKNLYKFRERLIVIETSNLSRFCFDHNSEMEGHRGLSDVLNRREFFLEDFETRPRSSKCFLGNLKLKSQYLLLQNPVKSRCWYFSYRFPRKHFDDLGRVSKS
jgi:hypothetical protein